MSEMRVVGIRVEQPQNQPVLLLRESDGDRYLPIWIGPSEADAIAVKLQDVSVPRPLTHDLLGAVISALGATVNRIVVSDLTNDTFYAKVVLNANGNSTEVDCRPSDAIAIAVRGGQLVAGPDEIGHWFASGSEAQKYLEEKGAY